MRRLVAVLACALLAACVSVPRATNEMESARAAFRTAAASPQVQARAPGELELAVRALQAAEGSYKADADPAMVAHLAYLAEQRARIALKTAELRENEAAIATASEQRSRLQMEQSARERDQALAQSKQAQLAAEQAAAEKRASETEVSRLQGELKARETDRGTVMTLGNDVLFDSGAATLKPGGRKAVDNLAALLQKQPSRNIQLEGYTDSTGSAETNRRLSEARAEGVKQALVERGIDPKRIETRGFGQAFPVASNETEAGRQLNRRVEVVMAPAPSSSAGGATR